MKSRVPKNRNPKNRVLFRNSLRHAICLSLALPVSYFVSTFAQAADVVKANNTNALNLGTSWTGGTAPGSGDVAVWNNTVTAANTTVLGANTSWQGIRIVNPTGLVTIGNGNTLTLGSSGIDVASTNAGLRIQSAVTLGANQSWVIGNGTAAEDLLFDSTVSNQAFNMGGFTVSTSGLGTMRFTSGYTISNGVFNLDAASNQFQSGGGRTTSLNNDVTLNLATGKTLVFGINSAPASGLAVNSAATININGGTLQINSSGAAGTNRMEQSGKVSFSGNSTVNNTSAFGYFTNFSGEVALAGTTTWNESGSSTANTTISGSLTGNGTLNYRGTSAGHFTILSGNNSGFAGTINLDGASGNRNLRLTNANAGSASATWAPSAGNTLQVDGVAVNLGILNGAGTVTNSHATNVAGITVGSGNFSGVISNGTVANGMTVTKVGAGTLALTGANSYSGLTDIQAGTLSTTTLQTGGGAVTVGDAGTFRMTQLANGATFNTSALTLGTTGGSNLALVNSSAPSVALITTSTFNVNGPSTISLVGTPVNNMTLIDYTGSIGGTSGFAGLSLSTPFRTSGTLFNDTTNTLVQLTNFAADTLKWQGNVNSTWDIDTSNTGASSGATSNWKTTAAPGGAYYVQAGAGVVDSPVFDDTATGSTSINLATTVTPVGVTFDNSILDYSVSGTGAIAGTTGIVKNGSAALTLATNNTFSGGVQLNAGTLNVNSSGALGTGTLAMAAGTTLDNTSGSAVVATNAQNWNGDFTFTGSNNLTLGAATMNADRQVTVNGGTLTVGSIAGSGFGLTKAGAGTLAVGASTYTGATVVNAGTLQSTNAAAFSNSSSVTLADFAGANIDLNGINQTIGTITGGGSTGGNIVLNGATLSTGTAANNTFAGALVSGSGAGGLTKIGTGTLTLSGNKSGYTGATSISGGTLDVGTVSGAFGTGNITGSNTVFFQGNGSTSTGITGGSSGIGARGGDFTVNIGGAAAIVQMNSSGTGGLGSFAFGSATSDSKVIVQNNVGINNFNGTRNITVNTGTGTASAEIAGVISNGAAGGNNGIVKLGAGDLILSNANTFTGTTTINAGRIVLGNSLALQNSALNTASVGKVTATGFAAPTLGGLTGSTDLATVIDTGYSNITTLTLNPQGIQSQTYSGVIADGAVGMNVVKTGTGTQVLSGSNTYTGSTTVNAGTLSLGHATNTLADGGAINVAGGTLAIGGNSDTVGVVTLASGSITGSTGVLTGSSYEVQSGSISAILGGTGANLTKSTAGSVTLSGANIYTGATTVDAGTLVINGDNSLATGAVTVNANGTLAGSGTVGGATTVFGALNPGNSPGTLTFTNSLTLDGTSITNLEITGIAANQFDIISGNGSNTLLLGGTLALDNTGYFGNATLGDTITIFNNWGTRSGTFSTITGLDLGGGLTWDTSNLYTAGSLTVTAVPEPGSIGLLAIVGIGGSLYRGLKKRKKTAIQV